MWREHGQGQGNVAAGADPSVHSLPAVALFAYIRRVDVELGLHSLPSTPTGLGSPRTEQVVAASAPSSEHVEDDTVPGHVPVSISDSQLQSTLPTAVDVGPSSNPSLVHGAQTANDEQHPRVHTGNTQPVMTDSERRELPSCRQR